MPGYILIDLLFKLMIKEDKHQGWKHLEVLTMLMRNKSKWFWQVVKLTYHRLPSSFVSTVCSEISVVSEVSEESEVAEISVVKEFSEVTEESEVTEVSVVKEQSEVTEESEVTEGKSNLR